MRASNIAKILRRSWKKTVLFIVLLTLVGVFLCLSGGVWVTAQRSIAKAEEDFTTIVVPSQPAMRELAGLKTQIDSKNYPYRMNDLASSYRNWMERQDAWKRYAALDEQVRKAGYTLSQVQPDSRRMAMAYVDGTSAARPDDILGMVTVYYFPPHDRVAYVVECVGTGELDWAGVYYPDSFADSAPFGSLYTGLNVKVRGHIVELQKHLVGNQQDVVFLNGKFATAGFKIEEILSLQPQVVREPEWLSAAVPIIPPSLDADAPTEQIFEPGKRYIVLGRYVGEAYAASSFGYIQKDGTITDDITLRYTDPTGDPFVNRQGGVNLLPKDWLADANLSTAFSNIHLHDIGFAYDEVRIELEGSLEDFLRDPANQYWKDALQDIQITNESVQVLTTGDTNSIFAFHQNRLSVVQGRDITPQEYADGTKVCLISRELAKLNGIRVGDTLPMQFYPGRFSVRPYTDEYFLNPTFIAQPMPYDASLGLTQAQEYTVVGIYSGEHPWDLSDFSVSANTVILPDNAMPQLTDVAPPDGESAIVSPLLYSLTIPNGQAQATYDELSELELGRLFAIMDQGYSVVMPGLATIRDNAAWMMLVCLIAWVAILILFLTLFILRQQKEVGIMRSMGAGRKAAVGYLIAGVVVVTLVSALLSAGGAYALYDVAFDVALRAPSMESERIDEYSVLPVVRNSDEEKQDLLRRAFVPENKGLIVVGIIGGQWLLIILASYICSQRLSGGNPMLMIQSKEE